MARVRMLCGCCKTWQIGLVKLLWDGKSLFGMVESVSRIPEVDGFSSHGHTLFQLRNLGHSIQTGGCRLTLELDIMFIGRPATGRKQTQETQKRASVSLLQV